MASRRLTISSLLCDDDAPDAPLAGPSTAPPIPARTVDRAEYYAYASHPHQHDYPTRYTPELKSLPDVVPLASPVHRRRRTPSPARQLDQSPSIPPSISRKSFREVAFDNYRPPPPTPPRSYPDVVDHSARHRSPGLDVPRYPPSRTAIDALVHKQPRSYSPVRPAYSSRLDPPSPARSVRPEVHYPSQPEASPSQHYVRSPSHSPVASFSPAHRRPPQSPLLSTTSGTFYAQSYSTYSHRPSASPVPPLSPVLPVSFPAASEAPYTRQPPSAEPHYSPTLAKPTLSALLTHSPPVSRASASSLPHILNSPVMSRTQGLDYSAGMAAASPGLEALEALAEVAAQERKRVHADDGATDASATLRGDPSPRTSPKVEHMDVDAVVAPAVDGMLVDARSPVLVARRSPTRSPIMRRVASAHVSPTTSPARADTRPSPVVDRGHFVSRTSPPAERPATRASPARDTAPRASSKSERVDGLLAATGALQDEHRDVVAASSPIHKTTSRSPVEPAKSPLAPSRMLTDEEPPTKRRRSSPPESAPQLPVVPPVVEVKPSPHVDTVKVQAVEPAPLLSVPEATKRTEPASSTPPSPKPPVSPRQGVPKPEVLSPVARHVDPVEEPSSKVSTPAPATKPKKIKTKEKPEGKKHVVKPKEKVSKPAEKVHVEQRQSKESQAQEEDVNEWLLEQTGGPSSPRMQPSGSNSGGKTSTAGTSSRPAEKHTSSVSPTVPHSHSHSHSTTTSSSRSKPAQNTKQKTKEARTRTRTSTPLALLEEELDFPEPQRGNHHSHAPHHSHNHNHAHAHTKHADGHGRKRDEMDVDSELDFAVAVEEDTFVRRQDAADMDMDVDAELLSLLDDQPHASSSSKPAPPASPAVPPLPEPAARRSPSPGKSAVSTNAHTVAPEVDAMPPPTTTAHSSKKSTDASVSTTPSVSAAATPAASSSKKKDPAPKPAPKKAPAPKTTKAKPKAKPKAAAAAATKKDGSATPAPPVASSSASSLAVPVPSGAGTGSARSKKGTPLPSGVAALTARRGVSTAGGASRSRSTSVMPGAEGEREGEGAADAADDKLYCICKTSYDEDRVMIACDRCDEWYHTSCVNMPDLEVDLVDQFICPVCIAKHPNLPLKTTYKTRCWAGLQHPNPASPEACHKSSRGAFSKYCSDECGVKYIATRIEQWGGDKRALWEAVKNAEPRQAVVLRVIPDTESDGTIKAEGAPPTDAAHPRTEIVKPSKTPAQRELERLEAQLVKVESKRELLTKDQEVMQWREKVVELAAARAERVQECGWDQRLCFGDEEVLEFGSEVLETYEEDERRSTPDGMQVDGVGEWWCKGKKKCDRHAGGRWQKLRQAEVELERELQEAQLDRLTTQEREIRKQIEGVVDHNAAQKPSNGPGPLQPHNGDIVPKSAPKAVPQLNGTEKKGKKRKAEK
ncbi:hypothetical protein EIP86_002922 [Pleurotus ostreatoroseus]|nr:hypothetical protein EIP86_002922 [Pleurotus ostreatoroseus]